VLNPGTQFTVTGPGGAQNVSLANGGATLGSFLPLYSLPNQLFLAPGNYTVTGNGGADIGGINTAITIGSPLIWTNRDQITNVDRTQPLTLNWSGAPPGQTVQILGENSDLPTNSSSLFFCVAPADATSFTVPPQVLAAISATRSSALDSTSVIFLMSSTLSSFNASGLSAGNALAIYRTGKTVVFQ
jgi:hypothetical protein